MGRIHIHLCVWEILRLKNWRQLTVKMRLVGFSAELFSDREVRWLGFSRDHPRLVRPSILQGSDG